MSKQPLMQWPNDAMVGIDEDGLIIDWGKGAERMFGWTRKEVLGKDVADVIIPEDYRTEHKKALERVRREHTSAILGTHREFPAETKDGREITISFAVWPIEAGEQLKFYATIRHAST